MRSQPSFSKKSIFLDSLVRPTTPWGVRKKRTLGGVGTPTPVNSKDRQAWDHRGRSTDPGHGQKAKGVPFLPDALTDAFRPFAGEQSQQFLPAILPLFLDGGHALTKPDVNFLTGRRGGRGGAAGKRGLLDRNR